MAFQDFWTTVERNAGLMQLHSKVAKRRNNGEQRSRAHKVKVKLLLVHNAARNMEQRR